MKAHNYPMERVDRMRPWLVAQVVTQLEYAAAGLDAENGVDVVLMRRAAGRKGIVPLESLDEQVGALRRPARRDAGDDAGRDPARGAGASRGHARHLAAWEQGDEQTLDDLLFGYASNGRGARRVLRARLLRAAIAAWRIASQRFRADGRPRFVVVGTGHLIGPQGIPELLAQRGFQVERVGSARVVPSADRAATRSTELPPPAATRGADGAGATTAPARTRRARRPRRRPARRCP